MNTLVIAASAGILAFGLVLLSRPRRGPLLSDEVIPTDVRQVELLRSRKNGR